MIMIVDDDVGMVEACAMMLESHGFEVNTASSGAEALSKLNGASPELLITDSEMPGMSGAELCKKLNGRRMIAPVPVLMISASMRREIPDFQSQYAFLRKPFLAENFLIEVERLLPGVRTPVNQHHLTRL